MKYLLFISFLILQSVLNEDEVEIVNSYNNTDELIEKFPVINPTTVEPGLERNIQNRLLTGFENWNRGFEAWKAWGDILYTKDSIYNVNGARLSLTQYQAAMNLSLKQVNILMGAFHNMIICDDFTAIRYDIIRIIGENEISGTVMEFVKFKDYGEELGTRVVEGWGGVKGNNYEGMLSFQGPEEKEIQEKQIENIMNYEIPDTDDLQEKYPVIYPTKYKGNKAKEILRIILKGFDSWNQGIDSYIKWVNEGYDSDAESTDTNDEKRTMSEYKSAMKSLVKKENIKKLYFNNILIRDDWAAIHYYYTSEDLEKGEKTWGDKMQFLKFEDKDDGLKIISSWIH